MCCVFKQYEIANIQQFSNYKINFVWFRYRKRWVHAWPVAQSCPTTGNPMDWSLQAFLSMEFSRQEYWSRLPFPTPEDLPNPGIKPTSPVSSVLAGRFFTTEPPGKPQTDTQIHKQWLSLGNKILILFLWFSILPDLIQWKCTAFTVRKNVTRTMQWLGVHEDLDGTYH